MVSQSSLPNSDGMGPVSSLLSRTSRLSCVRSPSSGGSVPDRLLSDSDSSVTKPAALVDTPSQNRMLSEVSQFLLLCQFVPSVAL